MGRLKGWGWDRGKGWGRGRGFVRSHRWTRGQGWWWREDWSHMVEWLVCAGDKPWTLFPQREKFGLQATSTTMMIGRRDPALGVTETLGIRESES